MYWISKSIHWLNRLKRRGLILLAVLGPGIITMVADNDAGGISTYAQTGAKTGFSLLWAFIILVPMAYYVQEMTVRLGAVTKRGHAEAIFDAFGPFWGWFSIFDLALINWLTLVTEYIGMTQAMRIFGIPEWITFLGVTLLMFGIVMSGRYWTFEKITLVVLPVQPGLHSGRHLGHADRQRGRGLGRGGPGVLQPHAQFGGILPGAALITLIMANIGTTITPWQIFFQQRAVVDKGMDVRDMKFGKIDTFFGSFLTCLVAAFIIIATAGVFYYPIPPRRADIEAVVEGRRTACTWRDVDRRQTLHAAYAQPLGRLGPAAVRHRPVRRRPARGAVHLAFDQLGGRRGVRLGPFAEQERARGALVLRRLSGYAPVGGRRVAGVQHRRAERDHDLRPGRGRDPVAGRAGVPDPVVERQAADGAVRQHALAKLRQLGDRDLRDRDFHGFWSLRVVFRVDACM